MMYKRVSIIRSAFYCKILFLILWCLGISAGCYCALHSSAALTSMMHRQEIIPMSIVGRYVLLGLPFVIMAFTIHFDLRFFYVPVVLLKSFIYSYSSCAIISMYGSSGWLCHILLLFFDLCTIPVLIFLCLRAIQKKLTQKELIICSIYVLIIAYIDHLAILPLTVELLNH